jgi:hypothetical protein
MLKIILGLSHMSVAQKIPFLRNVIQMMTGNPKFPTPTPTLEDAQESLSALESAKAKADEAKATSKEMTTLLNQQEDATDLVITKLANYVEVASNDNAAVIESAGFTPASKSKPVGELPAPQGVAASSGDNAGEIDVHWDFVKSSKSYIVQINIVDPLLEGEWKEKALPTKSSVTLTGLVSGTRYWVRVAAVGSAGTSGWSDPATRIAP